MTDLQDNPTVLVGYGILSAKEIRLAYEHTRNLEGEIYSKIEKYFLASMSATELYVDINFLVELTGVCTTIRDELYIAEKQQQEAVRLRKIEEEKNAKILSDNIAERASMIQRMKQQEVHEVKERLIALINAEIDTGTKLLKLYADDLIAKNEIILLPGIWNKSVARNTYGLAFLQSNFTNRIKAIEYFEDKKLPNGDYIRSHASVLDYYKYIESLKGKLHRSTYDVSLHHYGIVEIPDELKKFSIDTL